MSQTNTQPIPQIAVLKIRRESLGLPQCAVAKQAGIGGGTLSDLESGKQRNPGVVTLGKIIAALDELERRRRPTKPRSRARK